MRIVGYGAIFWGLVGFAAAAIGTTPDWLGRPFGALIGVAFICTGILVRALYDTRSSR